jgi:O-methyltransferase
MIAGIANVMGKDREYFLFDSFEGLPPPKEIDGPAAIDWSNNRDGPHYHDNCRAEMGYAEQAMGMAHVSNFKLIKGWFNDTVLDYRLSGPIALLRLDADWYESTMICLQRFGGEVARGGVILIDDYYTWDGCSKAVHDYLAANKLAWRIAQVDQVCVIRV